LKAKKPFVLTVDKSMSEEEDCGFIVLIAIGRGLVEKKKKQTNRKTNKAMHQPTTQTSDLLTTQIIERKKKKTCFL
jgi:hypothetical protein